VCLWLVVLDTGRGARNVEWTTPEFEEVSLNCEINSYANAEL
jgi:coenzyme PQQ precursor peptide PqqA